MMANCNPRQPHSNDIAVIFIFNKANFVDIHQSEIVR